LRALLRPGSRVLRAAGGRARSAVDREPAGPRRHPVEHARCTRARAPKGGRGPLLRPLPGAAERGRRGAPAAPGRARARPGAGADQPDPRLLHAVVLEDRPAQPLPLRAAPGRRACPGRDPRLRPRDRRRGAALGAAGLGGVRRLPARRHDLLARRARGGPAHARGRARRSRGARTLEARAGRAAREAGRGERIAVTEADVAAVVHRRVRIVNRGRYLDAQMVWEDAWRDAPTDDRAFLEALVQLAGGLQLRTRRGAMRGAEHLLSQALVTLEDYQPAMHGLDVATLVTDFGAYLEWLRSLRRPHRFADELRIPRLGAA